LKGASLVAWDSVSWEDDPWARGGYAYYDPSFNPAVREWLARRFAASSFAGEHTSLEGQGYMNARWSRVTGRREVAATRELET
jgi:monoamine oxidase